MNVFMIYTFRIDISSDDVLKFYRGTLEAISVVSEQGARLQFPFYHLRPFISKIGIKGRFRMVIDTDNRISVIEQIS
jgi:Protein of unknown function (DUF2835).